MAKLRDIAALTGVNISTVSKALLGKDDINPDTAIRIREVAKSLGYESKKKTTNDLKVIGVICPEITSDYYAQLLSGIEDSIKKSGYSLFVGFTNHEQQNESHYISKFRKAKVNGIVYISENPGMEEVLKEAGPAGGLPLILIAQNADIREFDCVKIDDGYGAELAVNHLISKGHKKIGYIGDTLSLSREQTYRKTLEKHGLAVNDKWTVSITERFEQCGYTGMKTILSQKALPTAVFCAYDDIAIGAMKAIREAGLEIPDDISLISIDNIRVAAFTHPGLTTVSSPISEAAHVALMTLGERMRTGETKPTRNILLNPELVVRESVKEIH